MVAAGLVLAVVLSAGCKKGEGATCYKLSDCADGLACVGASGDLNRCEKCDGADPCTDEGKCSVKEGACVAASDDDCKKGDICTSKGACTAKDGACVVGGDADCKQSEACKKEGFCKAKGNNCIRDKKAKSPEKKEEKKEEKKDGGSKDGG